VTNERRHTKSEAVLLGEVSPLRAGQAPPLPVKGLLAARSFKAREAFVESDRGQAAVPVERAQKICGGASSSWLKNPANSWCGAVWYQS